MTDRNETAALRPRAETADPANRQRSAETITPRSLIATGTLLLSGIGMALVYWWMVQPMSLFDWFPGPGVAVGFGEMLGPDVERRLLYIWGSAVALLLLW